VRQHARRFFNYQEGNMATANEIAKARTVDMKLEIVVIPVSDVDRAKHFYDSLGWRLDADFAAGDDYRVIQFTPPVRDVRSSSARTSPPRRQRSRRDSI